MKQVSNTPHFWHDKRYHSLDSYLKTTFGEKIYKISLDAGMTCPNRDGTLDTRGCIFCSSGGSGDFASDRTLSITEQIESGKTLIAKKHAHGRFIAYFQAYTNTYAPVTQLRNIFMEAIRHPDIVLLSIATRPDCLDDEILDLLCELQKIKPVWIELGLQTIHEQTASFIRRGYPLSCFNEVIHKLKAHSIPIIVHMILGLPGESKSQMFETVDYIASLDIFGIKLQLLHILKETDLARSYQKDPFHLFTMDEYVSLIADLIKRLPENIVIHRLTGDGPKNLLIAPVWSTDKKRVLNSIQKHLKETDTWQGKEHLL